MSLYLGIDTSNYTTSAAFYNDKSGEVVHARRLLPVKSGEKGIRQSDAVFHHTAALPEMIAEICAKYPERPVISAIGASDKPSNIEGSYMPCFTVGSGFARSFASVSGVKAFFHSHQHGHIAAALWSADRLDVISSPFLAFHVSGGTTEAVLCEPDEGEIFTCRRLSFSTDLKAGQAIDRVGLMLGLDFPAGRALDELSLKSEKKYKIKSSVKDGNPSLSGIQNKCEKMYNDGEPACDIALFCIKSVSASLRAMRDCLYEKYGELPVVYSGGVLCNTVIRRDLADKYSIFAIREFSSDNAVGAAVLAALKDKRSL